VHHILFYDYVENMAERRGPFRAAHLERIEAERGAGRLLMAGALGDPPHGAALVFAGAEASEIEAFAAADPYVQAGLVTARRIEVWKLA
jgi:uncharacterized protein YciI